MAGCARARAAALRAGVPGCKLAMPTEQRVAASGVFTALLLSVVSPGAVYARPRLQSTSTNTEECLPSGICLPQPWPPVIDHSHESGGQPTIPPCRWHATLVCHSQIAQMIWNSESTAACRSNLSAGGDQRFYRAPALCRRFPCGREREPQYQHYLSPTRIPR